MSNNIVYDVPSEPKTEYGSVKGELDAQIMDLRDDMDELTDTVHNQWVQFCNDNENIEVRLTAKCKKLFILAMVNMGVSGVLLCLILTLFVR